MILINLLILIVSFSSADLENLTTDEIMNLTDSLKREIGYEQSLLIDFYSEMEQLRFAMADPPQIFAADELFRRGAYGWSKITYLKIYETYVLPDSIRERALYMYSVISYQQGRYFECIDRTDEFLYIFPVSIYKNNTYILSALSNFSLAEFVECRNQCLKVEPSSDQFPFSLYLSAVSYYQEDKTIEGIVRAKEKLREMTTGVYSQYIQDKWKAKALLTLAQLFYESGELTSAYDHYLLSIDKGADKSIANLGIVWIFLKVNLVDDAIDILEEIERDNEDEILTVDIKLAQAAAYIQKGDYNRASDIYDKILNKYSGENESEDSLITSIGSKFASVIIEDLAETERIVNEIDELINVARVKGNYGLADSLERIKTSMELQKDVLHSIGFRISSFEASDVINIKQKIISVANSERAKTEELLRIVSFLQGRPDRFSTLEIVKIDSLKKQLTSMTMILADIENRIGASGLSQENQWIMQAEYGAGLSFFMKFKNIEDRLNMIEARRFEIEEQLSMDTLNIGDE